MENIDIDIKIEIPSQFLCPISLQLMRDPVILPTGITYDRDSIDKWLSTTASPVCPVTKQPLTGFDLTPNHTLRRLIQSWCTLHAADGVERIPTPKPPVDRSSVSKLILTAHRSKESLSNTLLRLNSIAARGPHRDRLALRSSGAVAFLASLMSTNHLALETLAHIDAGDEELRSAVTGEHVGNLIKLLSTGDSKSRLCAVKILKSVYTVAEPNQLMNIHPTLFDGTVRLIKDQVSSTESTKLALKLLIEVNPWGRNRVKAVEAGAVEAIIETLLMEARERRVCELAMVVLDQLCGCAEGRAALVGHAAGLAVVSKKILRVSNLVSERGVRVLGSISRYAANGVLVGEMLEVGVVAKLCLVLQVDCSLKTKERAKEILRAHSRVWRGSSCIPTHLLKSYPSC